MTRAGSGGSEAMIAGVTDQMVDAFALVGTPAQARKRLGDYEGLLDLGLLSCLDVL